MADQSSGDAGRIRREAPKDARQIASFGGGRQRQID